MCRCDRILLKSVKNPCNRNQIRILLNKVERTERRLLCYASSYLAPYLHFRNNAQDDVLAGNMNEMGPTRDRNARVLLVKLQQIAH